MDERFVDKFFKEETDSIDPKELDPNSTKIILDKHTCFIRMVREYDDSLSVIINEGHGDYRSSGYYWRKERFGESYGSFHCSTSKNNEWSMGLNNRKY